MMHVWKKLMTALLTLMLLLPMMGAAAEEADAVYGVCTAMEVNVRKTAGRSGALWFEINEGHVAQIIGTKTVSGEVWYKINTEHPNPNGRTYIGYVISDYFREMTAEETEDYLDSKATPVPENTPTPTPGAAVMTTGVITADGVNFRTGAGLQYGIYGKLNADTVVELLTIPDKIDSSHWYKIRYNGRVGYIQAPFIRVLTVDDSYLPDPDVYGYARLLEDTVNLRESAGGNTVTQWRGKGSTLRIVGEAEAKGSYLWYPVYYDKDSTIYYVREDMIEVVRMEGGVVVTPTPEPESPFGYIITIEPGVNLRLKPFGESVAQVPRGTLLACVGPSEHPAGTSYTWYKVRYKGMTGYLRGDCVRVCDSTGGDAGVRALLLADLAHEALAVREHERAESGGHEQRADDLFGPGRWERFTCANTLHQTFAQFYGGMASASYAPEEGTVAGKAFREAVQALFNKHAVRGRIATHVETVVYAGTLA